MEPVRLGDLVTLDCVLPPHVKRRGVYLGMTFHMTSKLNCHVSLAVDGMLEHSAIDCWSIVVLSTLEASNG
jgi:hypothetical protein